MAKRSFFFDVDGDLRIGRVIFGVLLALAFIFCLFGSIRVIGAEDVGVPVTLGKVGKNPAYGLSFKWPVISHYVRFDKTTQRMTLEDATYTKDLQPAKVKYSFNYRIVSDNAPQLYVLAGKAYEQKIIDPALDDALKAVFGLWTATDAVANREELATEIESRLEAELPKGYFTDITVKLDDIDYSETFEKGIEAKVLQEQESQRIKNKTAQIEEEAKQKVIQAKAEADAKIAAAEGAAKAMDIEGAAIRRNTQYLELKKLDVQSKMAESASHWTTVIMSGSQANTLLNIPSK